MALLALTTAACIGDPPPPAKGAVRVEIQGDCASETGFNIPGGEQATTSAYLGPRARDEDGASVACDRVMSTEETVIRADIAQDVYRATFDAALEQTGQDTYTGAGAATFRIGPDVLASAPGGCSISVSPRQDIGANRVWADFTCAELSGSSAARCSASGTLVFENCGFD